MQQALINNPLANPEEVRSKAKTQVAELNNCNGDQDGYAAVLASLFVIDRCPCQYKKNWCQPYMSLYREYKKGILPEEGGASDQCGYTSQIFKVIDLISSQIEAEIDKQRKAEQSVKRPTGGV